MCVAPDRARPAALHCTLLHPRRDRRQESLTPPDRDVCDQQRWPANSLKPMKSR